jgi:hypothetical protein
MSVNNKPKKSIPLTRLDYHSPWDFVLSPLKVGYSGIKHIITVNTNKVNVKPKDTLQQTAWLKEDGLIFTRNKILLPLKVVIKPYPEDHKKWTSHLIDFNQYLAEQKESFDFQFIEVIKTGNEGLASDYEHKVITDFFRTQSSKEWVNTLNTLELTYLKDIKDIMSTNIKGNNNKDFVYTNTYLLINTYKKRSEEDLKKQIIDLKNKENTLVEDKYYMTCEALTEAELEDFAIQSLNQLK